MNEDIRHYMDALSEDLRRKILEFRNTLLAHTGACDEGLAYGIPFIGKNGKRIIYYGITKKWIAVYPEADAIIAFEKKLEGYSTSKGTIRFPHTQEIDFNLIYEIIDYKIELINQ